LAEALIRWQHPTRGLLRPASFLPSIEELPVSLDVGDWVVDTALRQQRMWRERGLDIPVCVNVGTRQLLDAGFCDRLTKLLAIHLIPGEGKLQIDILETSAVEDVIRATEAIEACRKLGVLFSLDDFGTGYSSLTFLQRLGIGQLKIDQSLVLHMLDSPDDLAVVEGIVNMARAFRRRVLAEGVETVELGAALLQLGCDLAQGYGIAPPMPGDALPAWAGAWSPDPSWRGLVSSGRG
jgi:EAL domain-containing protein (putative c-di-GMP-specific phosphodiesterase class I)